jgi:hypothetical protein
MLGTLLLLFSANSANAGWDGSLTAEISPIDYLTGHLFGVSYEQQIGNSKHSVSQGLNFGEFGSWGYMESSSAWRMYPVGTFLTGMPVGAIYETEQYPIGESFRTSLGGLVGWKFTTQGGFCLRVELGPMLHLYDFGAGINKHAKRSEKQVFSDAAIADRIRSVELALKGTGIKPPKPKAQSPKVDHTETGSADSEECDGSRLG